MKKIIRYVCSIILVLCAGYLIYQRLKKPELTEMMILLEHTAVSIVGAVAGLTSGLLTPLIREDEKEDWL